MIHPAGGIRGPSTSQPTNHLMNAWPVVGGCRRNKLSLSSAVYRFTILLDMMFADLGGMKQGEFVQVRKANEISYQMRIGIIDW